VLHGELSFDQLLSLRPSASCARHATPLAGLYLCGPGTHPGGLIALGSVHLVQRALGV
jgi:phytoene dehydrogenase-like protein